MRGLGLGGGWLRPQLTSSGEVAFTMTPTLDAPSVPMLAPMSVAPLDPGSALITMFPSIKPAPLPPYAQHGAGGDCAVATAARAPASASLGDMACGTERRWRGTHGRPGHRR